MQTVDGRVPARHGQVLPPPPSASVAGTHDYAAGAGYKDVETRKTRMAAPVRFSR